MEGGEATAGQEGRSRVKRGESRWLIATIVWLDWTF